MPEFQRFSYDVLVIGAGGAGLRAAIEAAANGAKVGVVCKSLLGKAHTVMAEGGIAAALARCSTVPRTDAFCSGTSAGISIRAWPMSVIAPGWR
jgi:succinate dehydrogenase/fumarate reductase flavoprotein subunit